MFFVDYIVQISLNLKEGVPKTQHTQTIGRHNLCIVCPSLALARDLTAHKTWQIVNFILETMTKKEIFFWKPASQPRVGGEETSSEMISLEKAMQLLVVGYL